MTVPMENPIILNIMPSYGALLVGGYISQAIWGVSTLQVFFYFRSYEHDPLIVKLLIAAMWMADTTSQITIMKSVFSVLILEYGRTAGLLVNRVELTIHTLVTAVVVFVVQLYFIRRIYLFGKNHIWIKPLSLLLTLLSTWQLIGPIVYWAGAVNQPLEVQVEPFFININVSMRAAAVVVDVTVAICMIWLLTRVQSTAISQTRDMIFRILVVTVNSGTWTALFAFLVLIMIKLYPTDLYFTIFEFPWCSLYFSTLLANLNSRNYVRGGSGFSTIFGSGERNESERNPALVLGTVQFRRRDSESGTAIVGEDASIGHSTKQARVYIGPEYSVRDAV